MSRSYKYDGRSQAFMEELIEKETLASIKYMLKDHEKDKKAFDLDSKKPTDRFKNLKERLKNHEEEKLQAAMLAYKKTKFEERNTEEPTTHDISSDFDSFCTLPIDPKVASLLKSGEINFSKKYLKARLKQGPEEKYTCPMTSAMTIGWNLFSLIPKNAITHPVHGRVQIIKENFYSRNGVSLQSEKPKLSWIN